MKSPVLKMHVKNPAALREKLLEDLSSLDRHKEELLRLLGPLNMLATPKAQPVVKDFSGWTIPAAAKQVILEAGCPLTTRQILDAMEARGWRSNSKRVISAVHSGLYESPYIQRVGRKWTLSPKGRETEL